MERRIVLKRKCAISLLLIVISISLGIGYFSAKGIARGGRKENGYMGSAVKIQEFIEKEVEKNNDLETIEKEAKKLGKKDRLIVAFVEGYSYDTTMVNIMLDLDSKLPIVHSFEITGGK